ncbi:hypothetical protein SS50377_20113 [Spironucleus salmonicida]|uniref:Uncharacterized protein n=1 Tax=Spironucleus salmonicida TaxID=348837 RepID=V6LWL0_9EUKA|nr:hypothetical protein SS50377_20113 [Spironucleus salmonicida]|eukprot:EST45169.1 Hypothetical protein SS50377_14742 [Spironucleus salmonicida]
MSDFVDSLIYDRKFVEQQLSKFLLQELTFEQIIELLDHCSLMFDINQVRQIIDIIYSSHQQKFTKKEVLRIIYTIFFGFCLHETAIKFFFFDILEEKQIPIQLALEIFEGQQNLNHDKILEYKKELVYNQSIKINHQLFGSTDKINLLGFLSFESDLLK